MQPPFFYGWLIVAIVMLASFLAAGLSNITMAVVLKPISDDFGWSRSLTAAAVTMDALLAAYFRRSSAAYLAAKQAWSAFLHKSRRREICGRIQFAIVTATLAELPSLKTAVRVKTAPAVK